MTAPSLAACSARELARLIRSREASPVEITAAVLDHIEAYDDKLNAFLTVTGDLALNCARASENRQMHGELLGPLDGIPVSIKDLEPTKGVRTTFGCRLFTDHVPDGDGLVAERLRRAGAVLIGKTNTPHAGYKDMCDNMLGSPCVNPWNVSRTPGGSSGGAAAAVAAGFGPLAHGSDGAGSIRIPASLCGVVGFKPSFGRIPSAPSAEYWTHRVHHGPLARTVADAALFTSIASGADSRDPMSIDRPAIDGLIHELPSPLRIAWSRDLGYGAVDHEVGDIVERALQHFTELGHDVQNHNPTWEDPGVFHRTIYTAGLAAALRQRVEDHCDAVEADLRELIGAARAVSAVDLRAAEHARGRFYEQVHAFFQEVDVLVTPTMPITAWPAEPGPGPMSVNGISLLPHLRRSFFCYPFNLTGQPAITVPCGLTAEGLPVGMQIVGRWHADETVLSVAAAFESLRGPFPGPRGFEAVLSRTAGGDDVA